MKSDETERLHLVPSVAEPLPLASFDEERIGDDLRGAEERAGRAMAANTVRAYGSAWDRFVGYCEANGSTSLPAHPATVAAYLHARAEGARLSTVTTAYAAIAHRHRATGLTSPTDHPQVRLVVQGITRDLGRGATGKTPVRIEDLLALHDAHQGDTSLLWRRDWAVLLVGFASALRRSNLAALDVADVEIDARGAILTIRRSKTDQEGKGRFIGILRRPKLCPVRAVETWVREGGVHDGPLFRSLTRWGTVRAGRMPDETVDDLVKRRVDELGFDPRGYGAHSLRSGFATAAKAKSTRDVMDQGGWADPRQALRYQRKASLFDDNPTDILP